MKLPALVITLLCLTTTIICAAVPPANLPACTPSTNGLTICGSTPNSHNAIFTCNNLTWALLDTCTDPNTPCKNGTCTPSSPPCVEGETKCATTSPSTGIQVCKKGNWEVQQTCHCTTTTTNDGKTLPRCNPLKRNNMPSSDVAEGCSQGQVKCLAADANGRDGAVYKCNGIGRWDMIQDCSQYERCVMDPWAHCTWMGAFGV